ncbi:MAG: radical SAM protein [Planctomycetota bacterium]|jgi:pyruvate formate lyase activating enzyme
MTGIIFDIKEFAVHDGPGIRTTVFLKGCPLRCCWCHNPEGLSIEPQIMQSSVGQRIAGKEYTPRQLADILNGQADILHSNDGGVTFSGGEPLLQAEFVCEVIDLLDDLHIVLDTCGYGDEDKFRMLVEKSNLIHFDLKLMDTDAHLYHTGVRNEAILRNLKVLGEMQRPFIIRVPLIPQVTDTDENLSAIVSAICYMESLLAVELLPYNKAADGKYKAAGVEFKPTYDKSTGLNINTDIFETAGIKVKVVSRAN